MRETHTQVENKRENQKLTEEEVKRMKEMEK